MTGEAEEIHVLNGRVRLLQPHGGFRTSLDSVMLAAACPAGQGDRVLDMGAGVGGAAFCLLARVPDCHVTGVEIQPGYHALAERNIPLNDAEGRIAFALGDVTTHDAPPFDHAICNPPYLDNGDGTAAANAGRRAANAHGDAENLKHWIDAAFRLVRSNGSLTMIHRADRLDRIVLGLGKRFGATEIIPLWPRTGDAAKRVIVRTVKDRRSPCRLHGGIVLHDADGAYTARADAILRGAEPL